MELGDKINDRYVLEERLGAGGMAEVFRARDERLERSVAIKFLAPQLAEDPEFLVRFFSEAQSAARLSHPNVVAVLDFGDIDGHPYLVMQYVPGGSVADMLGEPILPERGLEIVRDAALGAGAAHEVGLIHRDIKPGNILLSEDGRATVVDFGIAQSAVSEKLTATGQVVGSPHYISPEQATGLGARRESDVYALGLVLYELLTGSPPFDADNATAIAIAHVDKEPEPPSARGAEVSPAIDALVLRCLAKDPAARFADGNALAAAIEATLEGRPVPAFVPPTAAVTEDAVEEPVEGRDPRKVGLVFAVVLVALIVGGFVWAGVGSAPRDERAAAAGDPSDVRPTDKASDADRGEVADDYAETDVTSTPTPHPSNTEEDDEEEQDRTVPEQSNGPDRGAGGGYTSSPAPTPTSEPSESPSYEPSPEPTPSEAAAEDPPD